MTAAERKFTAPPSSSPSWLQIAQKVFDAQAIRWDNKTCTGGLRWQIFTFNAGYNYKDSISNGQLMQLAARLYAYTKNQTYATWAEEAYTWASGNVGLINKDGSVLDGVQVESGCDSSSINRIEWSNNAGVWLHGAAVMANATDGDKTWTTRAQTLLKRTNIFLKDNVLVETACELNGKCNSDQRYFKGLLARDLARTAQAMPSTQDTINPILRSSASAAAKAGCANAKECDFVWTGAGNNGGSDRGSQVSAMQVIQANLLGQSKGTVNANGTSSGSSSGSGSSSSSANGTATGTASGTAAPTGAASEVRATSVTAMVLALAGLCAFGLA